MFSGETLLLSRHSPFHEIFVSEDALGLRTLRFGREGVRQSVVKPGDPEHLELPYANVMPLSLGFIEIPGRILVVGLGGGTLPAFFHYKLPQAQIDVVEIDPEVLAVAKSHLGFFEDDRLRVHIEDGRDFIQGAPGRYDLVLLDSFSAEDIPAHLLTHEFLTSVRAALSPTGIAVANVWGRGNNKLYDSMLRTYRAVFEDVYILDVFGPGTKVFVALPRPFSLSRDELLARVATLSQSLHFRSELGAFLTGFRHSDLETLRGGRILRD